MRCFRNLSYFLLYLLLFSHLSALAQSPIIKVDLNQADRPLKETNEKGYTPWQFRAGKADSILLKGVTISFTNSGANGSSIITDYYKAGIQAPSYARLSCDGITVKDGDKGAKITMRISGLPAGKHSLLLYHNTLQHPGNLECAPLNISVDGKKVVDKLMPGNRILIGADMTSAYLTLTAQKNKTVIIDIEADATSSATTKNVVINAFELNTPNIIHQSRIPVPFNGDEHVDADAGAISLQWSPAKTAVSHDLYVGADSASVAGAAKSSSLYKGNLEKTEWQTGKLYSMDTYYWRVDEIDATGTITKGNVWYFRPRQLAFKDAEGYGRYARGGRGGIVVTVTNLNDEGPGSLREAITANIGPRTIVFNVSGIITLKSRLVISHPYITIAGQTAPGKGICLRRAPLGVMGDDAIVRFMRVRLGSGRTYDGMGLTGANNSIVDHCSISWTIDEAFSSRGAHNITLQRTLISEALNVAGHGRYQAGKSHGYAASIGGNVGSFHHNLLAHCAGRNWSLAGGLDGNGNYSGKIDIRNNVVYNWDHRATDGGANEVNFVNNYYKPGAATSFFYALNAQHEGIGGGMQRYYFNGNVMPGHFDEQNQAVGRKFSGKPSFETFIDRAFFEPYVTTLSARDAYKNVLSDVGCNFPALDKHDIRIIRETLDSTYSYKGSLSGKPGLPDSQEDVGGWEDYPEEHRAADFDTDKDGLPDWWETLHNLNVRSAAGDFSDANADADKDGYTNLEQYLEWMAVPHYTATNGATVSIDLTTFARGFTQTPSFNVSNITNGKVGDIVKGIVKFKADRKGLSSFNFTVSDAEGSTMTRTINIVTL